MQQWVVLELTPKGEKEDPGAVRQAISRAIPGAEVYIPAVETRIGDDRVVHYLMQGYAFVRQASPERPVRAYLRLENTKYVNSVLRTTGRKLATVDSAYIDDLRERMNAEVNQGIGVGDTVVICSGPYKNIEASVIIELPETREVQVFIQLRSKQTLLTLPRSVLKVTDRAPLSHFFARVGYLRAWARLARVLISYSAPHDRLISTLEKYQKVTAWASQWDKAISLVTAERLKPDLDAIQTKAGLVDEVRRWQAKGMRLFSFIYYDAGGHMTGRLSAIEAGYLKAVCLDEIEARLQAISQEVEELAREMAASKKDRGVKTIRNIIIDGHNLAHRCFHAPGVSALKDSKGNLTGVIVGFLNSLSALKKRFPEAVFWVVWDGSSDRRRRQFRDYKADRKTAKFPEQEAFLRSILPALGVRQAWNPEEEADDVVGTLVRNRLASEPTVIFSTDRDFMQLVSPTVNLLVPSIGSRNEILFDPEGVRRALGVGPEKVVELRAFFGDKSDNLPGVPRVPKKTLTSLLIAHGSVSGVYSSGLSGLNKGQYDRLRTAESQVRINRDLMSLLNIEILNVDPDVDMDGAARKLRSIGAKPEPVIEAFFGKVPHLEETSA